MSVIENIKELDINFIDDPNEGGVSVYKSPEQDKLYIEADDGVSSQLNSIFITINEDGEVEASEAYGDIEEFGLDYLPKVGEVLSEEEIKEIINILIS